MSKIATAVISATLFAVAIPAMAQEQLAKSAVQRTTAQRLYDQPGQIAPAMRVRFRNARDAYDPRAERIAPAQAFAWSGAYPVATQPFQTAQWRDPYGFGGYADDNYYGSGYNNGRFDATYARRNSFVCLPGSRFIDENGRPQVCQ